MARWKEKLPSILRGEIKPTDSDEVAELAGYCAMFEKKYALATRIIIEASAADPTLLSNWMKTPKFRLGHSSRRRQRPGCQHDTTPCTRTLSPTGESNGFATCSPHPGRVAPLSSSNSTAIATSRRSASNRQSLNFPRPNGPSGRNSGPGSSRR